MKFENEAKVVEYVERELAAACPEGWHAERLSALTWKLSKGRPEYGYVFVAAPDGRMFVITHGNFDAPLTADRAAQKARYIPGAALAAYPLSQLVARVMASEGPNVWGLT